MGLFCAKHLTMVPQRLVEDLFAAWRKEEKPGREAQRLYRIAVTVILVRENILKP